MWKYEYMTVGPSEIETWAYGIKNGMTDDQIKADLLREFEMTPAIRMGIAMHELIEKHDQFHRWREGGFWSTEAKMLIPEKTARLTKAWAEENTASLIKEAWLKPYERQFNDWTFSLRGKIDGYDTSTGLIVDHKFKLNRTRPGYWEQYESSIQWKLYLLMYGLDKAMGFAYNIFEPIQDNPNDPPEYALAMGQPIKLYPYPGMEDDVWATLSEFFTWVFDQGDFIHQWKEKKKNRKR